MHNVIEYLKLLLITVLLLLAIPMRLSAQDVSEERQPTSSLSLELDPAAFLLNGYSFSLRYANKALPHWSVMASAYAADFPDPMMSPANRNAGWSDMRFATSHALFLDYTVRTDGRGFFIGPSVFLYDNRVRHEASGSDLAFRSIYPNVRVGYTWFPFKRNGFYLSPYLNMGSEWALGNTQVGDGPSYEPASFKYIAAIHIGYRFGR